MSGRREKRKKVKAGHQRQKSLDRRRSKKPKKRPKVLGIVEEDVRREKDGIIHCWNCGQALQAPEWIRLIAEQNSGEKTNSCQIECQCGEKNNYKF